MNLPLPELQRLRAQGLAARAAGQDQALAEVERRIVELVLAPPPPAPPRRLLALCCAAALLLAAAGYAWKGSPAALNPAPPPDRTEEMVARLAERLQREPDDAAGWAMLGRSYAVLGRLQASEQAYRQALARDAGNPGLHADLADVLATRAGGALEGAAGALIDKALALDARQPKALALAATRALRAGRRDEARALWQRLIEATPPEHPLHQSAQRSLAEPATP